MPTKLTVTAGVLVPADPEQVWAAAVDWPRQREWIWATRVEGGQGAGAVVTGWTGVGPIGFTDTMVITEWEPPWRCVVRHTGAVVRGTAEFGVHPRGDRTEFRWIERIELALPPPVGRIAAVVLGPVARLGLGTSLRRFARMFPASS